MKGKAKRKSQDLELENISRKYNRYKNNSDLYNIPVLVSYVYILGLVYIIGRKMLHKSEITLQILFVSICKILGFNKCFFCFMYCHCFAFRVSVLLQSQLQCKTPLSDTVLRRSGALKYNLASLIILNREFQDEILLSVIYVMIRRT